MLIFGTFLSRLGSKTWTLLPAGALTMAKQERYQLLEAAIYNLENMNNGRSQSQLLGMRKAASRDGGREVHVVKVHKGWQVMDVHVQSHV